MESTCIATQALVRHFLPSPEIVKETFSTTHEAYFRCDRVKQSVLDSIKVTRDDFRKITAHLRRLVPQTLREAVETSGLVLDQVHAVKIVGGSSFISSIEDKIKAFFHSTSVCS